MGVITGTGSQIIGSVIPVVYGVIQLTVGVSLMFAAHLGLFGKFIFTYIFLFAIMSFTLPWISDLFFSINIIIIFAIVIQHAELK